MEKIAIYGKGGVGKSTIASCLSASLAKKGLKVLHVGCDPKQDSTIRLTNGRRISTVIDVVQLKGNALGRDDIVTKGKFGVDCIECGGPKPGLGCGGRGITKMFEIIEELGIIKSGGYDAVIFDVLGDVVCGGFAAPLRSGFAEKVVIVISEEIMSLYAANNIMHAIDAYKRNNIRLAGLVLNIRGNEADAGAARRFSDVTKAKIMGEISRDQLITEAERNNKTVIEQFPDSESAKRFCSLADRIMQETGMKSDELKILDSAEFGDVIK